MRRGVTAFVFKYALPPSERLSSSRWSIVARQQWQRKGCRGFGLSASLFNCSGPDAQTLRDQMVRCRRAAQTMRAQSTATMSGTARTVAANENFEGER